MNMAFIGGFESFVISKVCLVPASSSFSKNIWLFSVKIMAFFGVLVTDSVLKQFARSDTPRHVQAALKLNKLSVVEKLEQVNVKWTKKKCKFLGFHYFHAG